MYLIEIGAVKDAGDNGPGPRPQTLQRLDQLEILLQKHPPRNLQRLRIRDPDPIDVLRLDAPLLQNPVQLRPGAVNDDGEQADGAEKGEGRGEGVEFLGDDCAADLDDCELGGGDGGEEVEVLVYFAAGGDCAEEAEDRFAGLGFGRGGCAVGPGGLHGRTGDGGGRGRA